MRLIDADALIDDIKTKLWDWDTVDGITSSTVLEQTITDIGNTPTIDAVPATIEGALGYLHKVGWMQEHDRIMTEDAVPVVRCKECKRWDEVTQVCDKFSNKHCSHLVGATGFCKWAERKGNEIY